MAEFATPQQIGAAEEDVKVWAQTYPEAAEKLKEVWGRHYLQVGHKRMGRLLLGRTVKALAPTESAEE